MDLSNRQIKSKLKEIIDFSRLEEFLDAKLEYFSTGMLARAGFSIRIFFIDLIKPEIILLDEALSGGGDIEFSRRAEDKMIKLLKSESTIILAGHQMEIIKNSCNKVIWLNKGEIIKNSVDIDLTINKYTSLFKRKK